VTIAPLVILIPLAGIVAAIFLVAVLVIRRR
jgi:hypothetical protein